MVYFDESVKKRDSIWFYQLILNVLIFMYNDPQFLEGRQPESCRKPDDPICALKEFKRVSLQKNESQKIEFDLDDTAFETINENGDSVLESGTYKVMVCDCAPVSSEKAHLVAKPACVYLEVK